MNGDCLMFVFVVLTMGWFDWHSAVNYEDNESQILYFLSGLI